jgi:hypothetical protein
MKSFKSRAEAHQKKFVSDRHGLLDKYCILKHENAVKHQLVDWIGIVEEIEKRRKIFKKDGSVKMPFRNMLRSEHIPYNFFIPLKLKNDNKVLAFFKKLLGRDDLEAVADFEIEWAPPSKPLDDKTSFDTYIKFNLSNQKKLGVGVEVKYTEKSYPFDKTESLRLQTKDQTSPYYKIWSASKIYKDDSYEILGTKKSKQFLRNHLLGLSIINTGPSETAINEFISLHLYPMGNEYQQKAADCYSKALLPDKQETFKAITFEDFIALGREVFTGKDELQWLDYLEARYIVK